VVTKNKPARHDALHYTHSVVQNGMFSVINWWPWHPH